MPRCEADDRLPKKARDEIVALYVHALPIRLKAHEMSAVLSGKMRSFFPMGRVRDGKLLPVDPPRITEDLTSGWHRGSGALPPTAGEIVPDPFKEGSYTWIEAPRCAGEACEVGPLARGVIARAAELGTGPRAGAPAARRLQPLLGPRAPPGTRGRDEGPRRRDGRLGDAGLARSARGDAVRDAA